MRLAILAPLALLAVMLTNAAAGADAPANLVAVPAEAFVPDVAIDAKGVVHVVYATSEKNGYYIRSEDKGKTFSPRVKINEGTTVGFTMGERGPKLALGAEGSIHVAWGEAWAPGVKTQARYSRSVDGGKSFEKARGVSSNTGIDGVTIAADDKNHVMVFWHVMEPKQEQVKQATWLWMSSSKDNGQSFGASEQVKSNFGTLACSMCMMRARVAADGEVLLAYRAAERSIRDFYVLKGKVGANAFVATRVNEDNWELPTCPMCGPEMTLDAKGQAVVAFMSRHKVYWSAGDEKLAAFKGHAGTPGQYKNDSDEIYPSAAMNAKGEVLMVWQNGPMSTTGKASVKWATYRADGTATGATGTLGTTTSGTKATVAVGPDDGFYILTTAK